MAKSATEKKEFIVAKALQCIDEVYPDSSTSNSINYPTETFFDEVVRWVIDTIPASVFEKGNVLSGNALAELNGYHGVATLGNNEVHSRILRVDDKSWARPVMDIITESDPLYRQQKNVVLRGNATRPVAVLKKDSDTMELYPYVAEVTISSVPYSVDGIPEAASDLASWKLAELVLLATSDTDAAAVCTAKVNEHLEILAK